MKKTENIKNSKIKNILKCNLKLSLQIAIVVILTFVICLFVWQVLGYDWRQILSVLQKIIVVFACYEFFGAVLPQIRHKKISQTADEAFSGKSVYGMKNCGERVLSVEGNLDPLIWRLRLINEAKDYVIYSTMNFRKDQSSTDVLAALLAAGERGVQVKLLVDSFSSKKFLRSKKLKSALKCPNIEVKAYNPLDILKPWRSQARLHDKYVIVDDEKYLLGGRNTNNLFLGNYGGRQNIDRELLVWNLSKNGGSVQDVKNYFEKIWQLRCCKIIHRGWFDYSEIKNTLTARFADLKKIYPQAFNKFDYEVNTYSAKKITFLANQTVPYNKEPVLWHNLIKIMAESKNILIQTPYLILSKDMYNDLTEIASSPNRSVGVITNSVETGANAWGCSNYLSQKNKLLQTGITIFECVSHDSCHLKCLMLDNCLSIVGSFNFDMRSCYLDTELMLVVDSDDLNSELRQYAETAVAKSRCVVSEKPISFGSLYEKVPLKPSKLLIYSSLRLVIIPIRFLL